MLGREKSWERMWGTKTLGKIAKKIRWKNVGKREKLGKKCCAMGFEKH